MMELRACPDLEARGGGLTDGGAKSAEIASCIA
ncbi:hypothetical protein BRADI_3g23295v3 [Brachypodium distachyon]|uniref:Uncharacterized protein n=1 Tax=Brachypodium distachyon TaxID=15368 RepID=A0A2K2CZ29_BRADI|nr:hypothetical protein BRADI_3g23295v3 [Brachypodium distachyon]